MFSTYVTKSVLVINPIQVKIYCAILSSLKNLRIIHFIIIIMVIIMTSIAITYTLSTRDRI